jgi:hypothetical protein
LAKWLFAPPQWSRRFTQNFGSSSFALGQMARSKIYRQILASLNIGQPSGTI